jgi:lysyl-tRNA synthetase, class II
MQKYDLVGQRQIRIAKADELRKKGIDPYPSKSNKNTNNQQIVDDFESFNDKEVIVTGRIMSWREHGGLLFSNIQDQSGSIQLYIKKEAIKDTDAKLGILGYDDLHLFDIGDIVEARGIVTKTLKGEISVLVNELKILTKSIRPLPDKWKGLQDKEKVFRQRYLDMIMNPDKRWRFIKTAEITFAIREFLNNKGFLEIKTPIIQPLYGGGLAKPFKTHVNALDSDYYLAISHELYLKRLITAGFENVYNIVGYFRNEGIDRTHNPEFQMLETMTAFKNYEYNMDLIEDMYKYVALKVFNKTEFSIGGNMIDFGKDWPRIKMIDAVKTYAGHDFNKITKLEDAKKILSQEGINAKFDTIAECMVEVFKEKVESQLIEPTFIYGHPVEISPLAKRMPEDSRFVERFEIFIGGIEGGDNWTELNDPVELLERFKDQYERRSDGDEETHPMDIDFLETMEYGMPPTTGLGPGIERLAMMFTDTEYIDDVIFFPMMRPANVTSTQKEIYGEKHTKGTSGNKKQDTSKKFVIVLDKNLTGWKLTNTIGHLSAYLGNKIPKEDFHSTEVFDTKDGSIKSDSQYPVVTMTAKQAQLKSLHIQLETSELESLSFINEMLELDDDKELAKALSKKSKDELNYLGIGLFGDKEKIEKITKKFSLYK